MTPLRVPSGHEGCYGIQKVEISYSDAINAFTCQAAHMAVTQGKLSDINWNQQGCEFILYFTTISVPKVWI